MADGQMHPRPTEAQPRVNHRSCDFCGKLRREVKVLVAAAKDAAVRGGTICNEYVVHAVTLIEGARHG